MDIIVLTNNSNQVLKVFCFVITELLAKHYTTINAHVRKQFAQQLNVYCNKTVLDEGPEEPHQYQWTYYNAFFFALTTLSTIGKYCDNKCIKVEGFSNRQQFLQTI